MLRMLRTGIDVMRVIVCIAALLVCFAPTASAENCTGVLNQSGCKPSPWNGQLQQTWNTPGYYGGWTNGPVKCDPATTLCVGWAQP